MAYTDPNSHIFVTGEVVTAANLKTYVGDNIVKLRNPDCVTAAGSAQNVANSAFVAIALDLADPYDNATMHNPAVNNTRLIAKTSGVFACGGCLSFAASGVGNARIIQLRVNGFFAISQQSTPPVGGGPTTDVNCSRDWLFALNDYLEILGWQNSGGVLQVLAASAASPVGWMHYASGAA